MFVDKVLSGWVSTLNRCFHLDCWHSVGVIMLQKDIVVHAENIRAGGGLLLLEHVVESYGARIKRIVLNKAVKIKGLEKSASPTSSSILSRLIARIDLSHRDLLHLHFGNLPPIYSASRDVAIYMHNALHFCRLNLIMRERPKLIVRLILERCFIRLFMRSHYKLMVQTEEMRRVVASSFPRNQVVIDKIFPRVEWPETKVGRDDRLYRIVYVGGEERYKNFQVVHNAVEEFSKLVAQALELVVIGDFDPEVSRSSCIKVSMLRKCSHESTLHEIAHSNVLLFASECESFGMPLWEAHYLGTPILAADRPYVFESCMPSHVFDPSNAASIVNALCLHFRVTRVNEPHADGLNFSAFKSGQ